MAEPREDEARHGGPGWWGAAAAVLALGLWAGCGPGVFRLAGTVLNPEDAGVTLALTGDGGAPVASALTDALGRYAFEGLAPGGYTLTPAMEGSRFSPASRALDLRADLDGVDFASRPVLQVHGRDLSALWQSVGVLHLGRPVADAGVQVNGEALEPAPSQPGLYWGRLARALAVGQLLTLQVTAGGSTVTGTAAVPEAPVLVAPAAGAHLEPGDDVVVRWTSATDPGSFTVTASWPCGEGCGSGRSFTAAGTARALTLAGADLPTGTTVTLTVMAYQDGAFEGDYAPHPTYPGMHVRAESAAVAVTR